MDADTNSVPIPSPARRVTIVYELGRVAPAVDPREEEAQRLIDVLGNYTDKAAEHYWNAWTAWLGSGGYWRGLPSFASVRATHRRANEIRYDVLASMCAYGEHPESPITTALIDQRIDTARTFSKSLEL